VIPEEKDNCPFPLPFEDSSFVIHFHCILPMNPDPVKMWQIQLKRKTMLQSGNFQ
jgi:hypothetical protein